MLKKKAALLGLFRSGTNFVKTVLEWNYNCRLINNLFGWKHGFVPITVRESPVQYKPCDIIFVTKNPFSSIHSLYTYYHNNGKNLIAANHWKDFLRKRFVIYDAHQKNSPQYRFANVVEFWNAMNWNYASVEHPKYNTVHVRYEDMLNAPFNSSLQVAKKLGFQQKFKTNEDFQIPHTKTRNMGERKKKKKEDYLTEKPFNADAYQNADYLKNFDQSDIEFVLSNLDTELAEHLGYGETIDKLKTTHSAHPQRPLDTPPNRD